MKPERRTPQPVRWLRRGIDLLLRTVSLYGAAVKVAQLAPVVVALGAVAVTPDAWLSATLRRWAIGGLLFGAILGVLAFPFVVRRAGELGRLALGAFVALIVSAGVLRLHLAVVSVPFIERFPLFQGLHDLYLGGGPALMLAYNVVAAALFAAMAAAAGMALPAWLLQRRANRERAASGAADGAPLAARIASLREALAQLDDQVDALAREAERVEAERRRLEAELRAGRAADERAGGNAPPAAEEPTALPD